MPMMDDPLVPEMSKPGSITHPVGVTGLRALAGYIREEFLIVLTGKRGAATFEEMSLNDPTCGAVIFAIKNLLRAIEWRVEPSDPEDQRAIDAAEMLRGMLFDDMENTWPEFIESISSMFVYGFAVNEIVWKKRNGANPVPWKSSKFDDGLWGIQSFSPRSQKTVERWIFDEEDHVVGFVQFPYDRPQINIPMSRCVHFTTTAELGNPEGRSLLRTAYRPWYWSKRMQEIEGIGTERDLAGYPVLTVPGDMLDPNATSDQKAALSAYETMIRKVRRDQNEGIILPSDRDDNGNLFYATRFTNTPPSAPPMEVIR